MKHIHYIYISVVLATLALLTACHSDDLVTSPTYTVGEADNAIVLSAGISEGGSGVMTRAAEDHHGAPGHLLFANGTKASLRVDGTWIGHSPVAVSQTTTATMGESSSDTGNGLLHNSLTMVPQRYWDDYGTADPANMPDVDGNGRDKGLTIYGVAVDGEATAPTVTDWEAHTWTLETDQTSGWASKDLLTSNNIKDGNDGTYKFDDWKNDIAHSTNTASNLLEFTHAMSKVTVKLKAGKGFLNYDPADDTKARFATAPTVTLKGFNNDGTVNVVTKTSTPTGSTADISAHLYEGGTANTAFFDALVYPQRTITETENDWLLTFTADGNTYYVNGKKLYAVMPASKVMQDGINYVIQITVNKTDIEVTATIKDWTDVTAESETPKINVTATYGYSVGTLSSTEFPNDYDLFRSISKATGYDEDNETAGINPAARFTSSAWDKTIYWPNHQIHYFFRGVYPKTGTAVSGTSAVSAEAVTTVNGNDVVAVANAAYTAATYPSDLAIAIPRKSDGSFDETCKESGHTSAEGICATEGVINMNFEYAMSKVEVRLKSTATDAGHIAMTKNNTKVEIIGGYSKARIKLSDGLHDDYVDGTDKGDYTLSNLETPVTDFLVTSRDAIVPQAISDVVKFRITYTNDNGTPGDTSDDHNDVYECQVNKIKDSSSNVIGEWEHGKHYIYVLDINKTAITSTATLTDWVTVTASEDVWF